jgi:hypothetical protein
MIAKRSQRACHHTIEGFHMSQHTRMTGDPGLCGAGRHSDANTNLPFQFKPWLEGTSQV